MTNNVEEKTKTIPLTCYHCGRMIWEDPRGHIGCLNTRCRRIFMAEPKDTAKNN